MSFPGMLGHYVWTFASVSVAVITTRHRAGIWFFLRTFLFSPFLTEHSRIGQRCRTVSMARLAIDSRARGRPRTRGPLQERRAIACFSRGPPLRRQPCSEAKQLSIKKAVVGRARVPSITRPPWKGAPLQASSAACRFPGMAPHAFGGEVARRSAGREQGDGCLRPPARTGALQRGGGTSRSGWCRRGAAAAVRVQVRRRGEGALASASGSKRGRPLQVFWGRAVGFEYGGGVVWEFLVKV